MNVENEGNEHCNTCVEKRTKKTLNHYKTKGKNVESKK